MTGQTKYYHGGDRGLFLGGHILPPTVTGKPATSDFVVMNGLYRKDRVYVTTRLSSAQLYASGQRKPTVYEVEPVGDLEDDPDCKEPGLSYACEKAKIVAIHNVPGKIIKKARKAFLTKGR